jgi:hypothetical protein
LRRHNTHSVEFSKWRLTNRQAPALLAAPSVVASLQVVWAPSPRCDVTIGQTAVVGRSGASAGGWGRGGRRGDWGRITGPVDRTDASLNVEGDKGSAYRASIELTLVHIAGLHGSTLPVQEKVSNQCQCGAWYDTCTAQQRMGMRMTVWFTACTFGVPSGLS